MNNIIFLGIDPGVARTGYAFLNLQNNKISIIDYGCINTNKTKNLSRRIFTIYTKLQDLIKKYKPNYICVEELFFSKNTKTAMLVGQARGIILLLAEINNIQLLEFKPIQVKQAVCGYGKADKQQIQRMIKTLLNLKQIPKPDDTADALAICWCGINSYKNLLIRNKNL